MTKEKQWKQKEETGVAGTAEGTGEAPRMMLYDAWEVVFCHEQCCEILDPDGRRGVAAAGKLETLMTREEAAVYFGRNTQRTLAYGALGDSLHGPTDIASVGAMVYLERLRRILDARLLKAEMEQLMEERFSSLSAAKIEQEIISGIEGFSKLKVAEQGRVVKAALDDSEEYAALSVKHFSSEEIVHRLRLEIDSLDRQYKFLKAWLYGRSGARGDD